MANINLNNHKEAIAKVLTEEMRRQQQETLSELDILRKTRAARGGVGAPLKVPAHLAGANSIIRDAEDIRDFREIRRKEVEVAKSEPIDGDDYSTIDDPTSQNAPK